MILAEPAYALNSTVPDAGTPLLRIRANCRVSRTVRRDHGRKDCRDLIAESEVRPRQLLDRRGAHQLHVALDLCAHQPKRALDTRLACGSQGKKIEPADAHRLGA